MSAHRAEQQPNDWVTNNSCPGIHQDYLVKLHNRMPNYVFLANFVEGDQK